LLANLCWLSTERVSYPRKITKNLAFHRFRYLSVEIIEEKKPLKSYPQPIHYALLHRRNPAVWQDSGCPDKYMKTQCN
jgi:hypothetical protein